MDKKIFLLCVILLIVLSACGPSAEVITLTIVAEMDHAATLAVPTATATLAATSTPVPTHTPTATTVPTKTPISDPDINAMINWQALNLDSSFEAVAPASIGFEKGAIAFGLSLASGDIVYIIENSFVFENSDEQVYGYAVNLKDDVEGAIINLMIPEWENRVESTFNSGGKTLQDFNTISGAGGVGEISRGVHIEYTSGGRNIVLEQVPFRIGDIFVQVFIKNYKGEDPSISIIDLAQTYAASILNPIQYCQITQLDAVGGVTWPEFEYRVEGFYPGEPFVTFFESHGEIGGEKVFVRNLFGMFDVPTAEMVLAKIEDNPHDLGALNFDPEYVNQQGQISEFILFALEGEPVVLEPEFKLRFIGAYSGCDVEQVVSWPDE